MKKIYSLVANNACDSQCAAPAASNKSDFLKPTLLCRQALWGRNATKSSKRLQRGD